VGWLMEHVKPLKGGYRAHADRRLSALETVSTAAQGVR